MANAKFVAEAGELKQVKNSDLVCKDCIYKKEVVARCEMYPQIKLVSILKGGLCNFYEKENKRKKD